MACRKEADRRYELKRRRYKPAVVKRAEDPVERISATERMDYLQASLEERLAVEVCARRMLELEAWWDAGNARKPRPGHLEDPSAVVGALGAPDGRRMQLEKAACERAYEIRGGGRGATRKAKWRAA